MTDGVTEKANKSQLLDSGLSIKVYNLGNPVIVKLKCDGEAACSENFGYFELYNRSRN